MTKKIDIVIQGGTVYDGTGLEPYRADIGISGDRISFIGNAADYSSGARMIEADSLCVTPGFIDAHAHSEFTILADPLAEGKICQGVTTEINGNCGLSAAPLYGMAMIQREKDLEEYGIRERWSSFGEYFHVLEEKGIALNFATLAGHGNIRACVVGYENRKLAAGEREEMKRLLREALSDGAIGLSTGLIYPPGIYSDTEELTQLSAVTPLYTSHMRSEGDKLLESIEEVIRIASGSGVRVHISHVKTSGESNWHKIEDAISLMEGARKAGIRLTCDRYPYTASSTDLDTILPSWTFEGGAAEELKRLRTAEVRKRIVEEIAAEHREEDRYWETVIVSSLPSQENKWMEGRDIHDICLTTGERHVEFLLRILEHEELRIGAIFASMSEENLRRFLSLPYVMIGTDSSARSIGGRTDRGKPHPRGFGSFPRFLGRYVRDSGLMGMAEAVRKITSFPAQTFGIRHRGILTEGAFADIAVFDAKTIIDEATYDEPFRKPRGVSHVFVNGVPVVRDGELTGDLPGRVLRNG